MALLFLYGSGSPFAWRVWLGLEHKGLDYEARRLHFDRGDTKTAEFLALNPRGKVPVLVHDGRPLRESIVILEYLDEVFPGPALLPAEPLARARLRILARETEEHLGQPLRRLLGQTLFEPEGDGDPAEIAAARQDVEAELSRIATELEGSFFHGDAPGLADFVLYPYLRHLRRIGERMPQHRADDLVPPVLALWATRIEALPYYHRTLPPHWKE